VESDGINRFEELCLRWARGALIATIAVGCLAIVGGLVVAGAVWLWPGPARPSIPAVFEPVKYDLKMAEKWATDNQSRVRQIERDAQLVEQPGQVPATLTSLFPNPPYATADVWESYCKVPTEYGCLEKGRRLVTPSPARTFEVIFHGAEEEVRDELVKVLATHLPNIAVEKRLGMVAPLLFSYVDLKKENDAAENAHAEKVKDAQNAFAAAVASHHESQLGISMMGLSSAGWGLGAVLSASVFVALLAIERHLRAIRSGSREATASSSVAA
jgi:hypothetical protein